MQNQNNQKQSKIKNLYSKFKEYCVLHNIPTVIFPIVILIVFALTFVLIGGAIAGWNISKLLTSSTALLMYVVFGVVVVALIGYYFIYKIDRR